MFDLTPTLRKASQHILFALNAGAKRSATDMKLFGTEVARPAPEMQPEGNGKGKLNQWRKNKWALAPGFGWTDQVIPYTIYRRR